jgi:hypothetical protein
MSALIPAALALFGNETEPDIEDDDSEEICPECPHTIGEHEPQDEDETILVCVECGCTIEHDDDEDDDEEDDDDEDDEDDDDEDDD